MLTPTESLESEAARQCLRDVVSLSLVTGIWTGADPRRILESLAATLFTTLEAQFAYVAFAGGEGEPPLAIAQVDRHQTSAELAERIGPLILDWARTRDPAEVLELASPSGNGTIRVALRPLGLQSELGVIAAGFGQKNSPTAAQNVVLNIAASQASSALQNARLLQTLRQSEARFRAIVSQTTVGIAQTELTGQFLFVNDRYCEIVGYSRDELLRKRMQDITHPDDLTRNLPPFEQLVRDGTPFVIEKRYLRKDGSAVWVQNSVSAIRDAAGKTKHVLAVTLDITARKQTEEQRNALLESEREARQEAETLNDLARALAGELDLQKLLQLATDAGTKLTGAKFGAFFYNVTNDEGESYLLYTLSGAPRQAFEKFGTPRNTPIFAHTFQGLGVVRSDDILQHPSYGKIPPHHGMPKGHLPVRSYLAIPVKSRSGSVIGGLFFGHPEPAVFTPRTERIGVAISSQAAIAIDNAQLFSKAETELAERKRAEENLRQANSELSRRLDELQQASTELEDSRRAALNVMEDAVQARAAIEESEQRYRSLVSVITDVPWTADANGAFTTRQTAWESYTGQTWEEYRGYGWVNALHPDDRQHIRRLWENLHEGGTLFQSEGRLWHAASGQHRFFLARATPLYDADRSVREWVGSCTDVHAQRQAEELLRSEATRLDVLVQQRTARLYETIGELEAFSYSIAHDLRAPLRALQGFGRFLSDEYADKIDAKGQEYLRRLTTAAARMDRLILDILNYSQIVRGELPLTRVDIGKLLRDILDTYPGFQQDNATITLEGAFPEVIGNEAALTQCFSNLVGNAVKFVAAGIRPRVQIWAETMEHRVKIFVNDNGIGIAPEQHNRIFAIFQRLSKAYDGTGIGLAIVKKTAERMGGKVGVDSEPGKGSTFWVELPRAIEEGPT